MFHYIFNQFPPGIVFSSEEIHQKCWNKDILVHRISRGRSRHEQCSRKDACHTLKYWKWAQHIWILTSTELFTCLWQLWCPILAGDWRRCWGGCPSAGPGHGPASPCRAGDWRQRRCRRCCRGGCTRHCDPSRWSPPSTSYGLWSYSGPSPGTWLALLDLNL